jgi:hypothetical protein
MKLKSALIVCIALVAFTQTSKAQLKTEFGLKGGLNVSGLSLNSDKKLSGAKYNNLLGLHFGAYALLRTGKFGIQPEIVYSQQGQLYNIGSYSNLRTELNYINVPVVVKYYLVGGLNVQAGAQLGVLVSAKGDLVNSTGGQPVAILGQNIKSYVNSTDLGLSFGAGIDIPFGLNLNLRYNIGVSNVNKYQSAGSSSGNSPSFSLANAHNQVLQLSVGYRLYKLGK